MSYDAEVYLNADQLLRLECARINPNPACAREIYAFVKSGADDADIIRAAHALAGVIDAQK